MFPQTPWRWKSSLYMFNLFGEPAAQCKAGSARVAEGATFKPESVGDGRGGHVRECWPLTHGYKTDPIILHKRVTYRFPPQLRVAGRYLYLYTR